MILTRALSALILAAILTSAAAAQELTGTVVGISDGDTITVLVDRQQLRIRLHGIDAPEKGQPYSDAAKRYLSATHKRTVRVATKGKDRYQRTLAVVYLPTDAGDLDVNADMVNTGLAWSYRQFSKDYAANEDAARRDRRGLWQDPNPIPPWQWRKPAARKASAVLAGPQHPSVRLSRFRRTSTGLAPGALPEAAAVTRALLSSAGVGVCSCGPARPSAVRDAHRRPRPTPFSGCSAVTSGQHQHSSSGPAGGGRGQSAPASPSGIARQGAA